MVKITSPLYTSTAHGHLKGVGVYRRAAGGRAVLQQPPRVTRPPVTFTPEERAGFLAARAAWLAIQPTWILKGKRWRFIRSPTWPDFARAWYAENNSWAH